MYINIYVRITGPINSLSFKIRHQVVLDIYPSPFPPSTTLRHRHHHHRLSPYLSSLLASASQLATTVNPLRVRICDYVCVCVCIVLRGRVCEYVCARNKSTFVTKRGQGNSILLCITSSGCETGVYTDGGAGVERVPV